MQNGVSLIVLHFLMNVLHSILFSNLGDKCVTLALLFSFDASVVVHTCKGVCQKWHASFETDQVTFISTIKLKYTQVTLVLLHINSCTQNILLLKQMAHHRKPLMLVWNCVISNKQYSTEIKVWLSIKPVLSLSNSFWTRVHTVVECFVQRNLWFFSAWLNL